MVRKVNNTTESSTLKNTLMNSTPMSYLINKTMNNKSKFTNTDEAKKTGGGIGGAIGVILWIIALVMVFRCNRDKPFGQYWLQFVFAFCCSPIYIIVSFFAGWCSMQKLK